MSKLLRISILPWTCCVCVAVAVAEDVGEKEMKRRPPPGAVGPVTGEARPGAIPTSPPTPTPTFEMKPLPRPDAEDAFAGTWSIDGNRARAIHIRGYGNGMYLLRQAGEWEALGFFDGKDYWGLFRWSVPARPGSPGPQYGTHHGVHQADGSLRVRGALQGTATDFEQIWTRASRSGLGTEEELPRFGEYVYVEVLPEALTKVEPDYPPTPGRPPVSGTVMVQGLVGKDGRVFEVKIVQSVPDYPELDEAASAAVRRWTFKPASANGKPVAVWVAIPIKFTPH